MVYCPPELARDPAVYISESAEVFVFGLILAEVAGASRPWPINDKRYEVTLKSLPCDAWVQVRDACTGTFINGHQCLIQTAALHLHDIPEHAVHLSPFSRIHFTTST